MTVSPFIKDFYRTQVKLNLTKLKKSMKKPAKLQASLILSRD
ncbi:hypothetical protein [Acinetobacter bereziniae]|nr:hypothetical protein [Acinetobacter bereziniae]